MKLPIRCRIPEEAVKDDVRWLEIAEGDGGHFLFQYAELGQPSKWDSFYNSSFSLEEVLMDCQEGWGIDESAWTEVDVDWIRGDKGNLVRVLRKNSGREQKGGGRKGDESECH